MKKSIRKYVSSFRKLASWKLLLKTYESMPGLVYETSLPLRVAYIEVSSKCNLHCKMCYRGARNDFMSFTMFQNIIGELYGKHVSLGLHFAGESTLHPQFAQMLEYIGIRKEGFNNVGFVTNGTLLTEELMDKIIEYNVDYVTFSLEGYADINDSIRLGSSYDVVAENIEYLLAHRKEKRPFIEINGTMQPDHNEEAWKRFVSEWIRKVDRISFNPCIDADFQWKTFWSDVNLVHPSYCNIPFTTINILTDGSMISCGCDLEGKTHIGNVKDGIMNVWKGPVLKQLQYNLLTKTKTGFLCDTCERWQNEVKEPAQIQDNVKISYFKWVKQYELAAAHS